VYGARGKNSLQTMLRLGAERDELSVWPDQIGWADVVPSIAALTFSALSQLLGSNEDDLMRDSGIYHLTAVWRRPRGAVSPRPYSITRSRRRSRSIKAIPTASYPNSRGPAPPLNSRLSNHKLFTTFGLKAPDWQEALRLCMAESA